MVDPLIGIHAGLGELGVICFLWVFIEILAPTKNRVRRAKIASLIGLSAFILSWIAGGFYYVVDYGNGVKPVIKSGPQPWAHSIFMETKEHVFLFLPFLAFLTFAILKEYEKKILRDGNVKKAVLYLSAILVIFGILMTVMGYLISSAMRTALEVGA